MILIDFSNSSVLWVCYRAKFPCFTVTFIPLSSKLRRVTRTQQVINECWLKLLMWQILKSREDSCKPSTLWRGPITASWEHNSCPQLLFVWSYKNCREMPDFFRLWIIISSWSLLNGLLRSVNTSICLFSNFFPLEDRISTLTNHSSESFPTNSNVLSHWAEKG